MFVIFIHNFTFNSEFLQYMHIYFVLRVNLRQMRRIRLRLYAKTDVLYSIFRKMREGIFCFLFNLSSVGAQAARPQQNQPLVL